MEALKKITVSSVLSEGFGIGMKNSVSLLVAAILWLVTIWVPYLNVGTTIAMCSIPVELSKGKVISPTFIFDSKYRRYMGEYFTLIGLMFMALVPAFLFLIVPGIIISIGWSLSVFILLDKGVAPGEALVRSNKATYGYKLTIFAVSLILGIVFNVLSIIFALIPVLGLILNFALMLVFVVANLGCYAVIYRNLVLETDDADVQEFIE